uniref:U1740ag n=1 Tax=Mycobacterium leprae TaxID=1769 RepID=Q50091_MYCLR|nr:u1740ag [Mycobacterium leprae]
MYLSVSWSPLKYIRKWAITNDETILANDTQPLIVLESQNPPHADVTKVVGVERPGSQVAVHNEPGNWPSRIKYPQLRIPDNCSSNETNSIKKPCKRKILYTT